MRFIGSWAPHPTGAGHNGPITCLEWSPDGSRLATGSYDGTAIIWDANSWEALSVLWHSRLVNGIRWSPNQRWVATACADGHCRVWSVATGEEALVFSRHTDDVNTLAWSPTSDELITVSEDGTGRMWRVTEYVLGEGVIVHEDHCMSVDWQPEGRLLVTCGEDAAIRLSSPDEGTLATLEQDADLEMVRWNPAGTHFAAAADNMQVLVFDADGQRTCSLGPHGGSVKSVAWSPDGQHLASGSYDSSISVWDVTSTELIDRFQDARIWPRALHWSPRGDRLAVGAQGGRPRLLGVAGGRTPVLVPQATPTDLPTVGVNCIELDGSDVYVGLDDGSIRRWNEGNGAIEVLVEPGPGSALVNAISGDASGLWFGTFDGLLGRLEDGGRRRVPDLAVGSPVNAVVRAPREPYVAVATYDGAVHIVEPDVNGSKLLARHALNVGAIKSVAWVDDHLMAVGSTDANVYLLHVDGRIKGVLKGHGNLVNAVAVGTGANGPIVASASRDRTVRLFDLEEQHCIQVLIGHTESVKSVCWVDAAAGVLASGSYDFDARIWRHESRPPDVEYCAVLPYHLQGVSALKFGEPGLVTGSWDGSIGIWSVEERALVRSVELGRVT